jgi:hypothetical protein
MNADRETGAPAVWYSPNHRPVRFVRLASDDRFQARTGKKSFSMDSLTTRSLACRPSRSKRWCSTVSQWSFEQARRRCLVSSGGIMIALSSSSRKIEGGGEGVLVSLWSLVHRYARLQRIETVEWIVHAVTCAKPNLKLRRVLHCRGFTVRDIHGNGQAYYYLDATNAGH